MRGLIVAGVVIVAAGVGAGYGALGLYESAGPLPDARSIMVPHGKLENVAESLARDGVVRSALVFRAAAMATFADGPVRAGELSFPAGASLATVLGILRHGRPVQHRVTIAEGLTAAQISRILAGEAGLEGDIDVPGEGALLPDTYSFELGTNAEQLTARAHAALARALSAAWAARTPGLPLRTPQEALILASVVEREARLPAERPMIARVFLNRIEAHMRLQSDPTTVYAAAGGLGSLAREITHDDLAREDPYNTYVIDGLPAGPICSPGVATIQAVLHPSSGSALYFVADGTGGHIFANSLAAHNANVLLQRARRR